MKREVKGTFTFECAQHKVALVVAPHASFSEFLSRGGPLLIQTTAFGPWTINLDEGMTCPATGPKARGGLYRKTDETLDWCLSHWRAWLDADTPG